MKINLVPIHTVINDYLDLTDYKGRLEKNVLLKWANDIAEKLQFEDSLIHKVALLPIDNYQVRVPDDLRKITLVAFRAPDERKVRRYEIVEWTQKVLDGSGCEFKITLECPQCKQIDCSCSSPEVVIDVDRMWELNHPETKYGYMSHFVRTGGWVNDGHPVSTYHPEFVILRAAQHNFFNADHYVKGCLNLNKKLLAEMPFEFLYEPPYIRVNSESGHVLLSYFAHRTDGGYLMVPNTPYAFEAMTWYIEERMLYRDFRRTGDTSHLKASQLAMQQKEIAMGRARELLGTPDFHSWWSFMENVTMRVYPYYDFYQQMGRKQRDVYDTTMSRLTKL